MFQISAKLEFDDELSPVPMHGEEEEYYTEGNEYADNLNCVVNLLSSIG